MRFRQLLANNSLTMLIRHANAVREVIGLLPAAGQAKRISPLPTSKELFPIGFQEVAGMGLRPKVVCQYLLEKMAIAGIQKVFVLLRPGKWDIPAYLESGTQLDLNLAYLVVQHLQSVAHTLDHAYPFVRDAIIATGFPDILFQPDDAYKHLIRRLHTCQADVVLGVVPFDQPHKGGMVAIDESGRVSQVIEKPLQSELRHSWFIAVWAPAFTEFLHQYLIKLDHQAQQSPSPQSPSPQQELPLGDVIQAAIAHNMRVEAVVFPTGSYLDIGTPADLVRAVHHFSHWPNSAIP